MNYAQAVASPGAWTLSDNDVWSVPDGLSEIRFEIETSGPWSIVKSLRGLAVTLDGKVFGMRRLIRPRESGYQMEGRVSIGGEKFRAFTSSTLFERPDRSLIDVGVLVVCNFDEKVSQS